MNRQELLNEIRAIISAAPDNFDIAVGNKFVSVAKLSYMENGDRYCSGWTNFRDTDSENETYYKLKSLRWCAKRKAV